MTKVFPWEDIKMYLKQSDLFLGLGHNFLKEFMAIAEKVTFDSGEIVFREGNPANYFYIMISGQISLILSEQVVYTTSRIGEIFGCASIIGRDSYFLTAQCDQPSVLLRCDQRKMHTILESDIDNGFVFFKQLSGALAHRLYQMYQKISDKSG
jgi:signal-transduction protein with cAMP-binding, CBS, and nucleotidyltransferase domain